MRRLPILFLIGALGASLLAAGPTQAADGGWGISSFFGKLFGGDEKPKAEPKPKPAPAPQNGAQDQAPAQPNAARPVPVVPPGSAGTGTDTSTGAATQARTVPQDRAEIDLSFAPLVKKTAPAVVNVYAARAVPAQRSPFAGDPFFGQFFGQRFQQRPRMEASLGSGAIIDPSGLVVTNNHVVENADQVKIAFADGRQFDTTVLLKDKKVDLAVLKIKDDQTETFPTLQFADSDKLEIGDLVLAIGNPFGIGQTVTNGIVSALARSHIGVEDFGFFIQTDAAINPGNSGGALIDMNGRLAGVNTAIFSRSGGSNGIGFAIPSNMVESFVKAAKAGHKFEQPYVGADFAEVTPDIADALGLDRPTGALVKSIADGSPAADAGLKVGDVVLSVGGFPVDNPDALGYRLATAGVGKVVDFMILRGDSRQTVSVKLASPPEIPPRDKRVIDGNNPFNGATVLNLSPKVASELDLPQDRTGVVVSDVARGSLAQRFGLKPKDIVLSLNGQDVSSTQDLADLLDRNWSGWRFRVDRDGQVLTQAVR